MKPITLFLLVSLGLVLSACSAWQKNSGISCSKPRPQVCTMRYAPVCARLNDGSVATYSSACKACADVAVSGYVPGGPCDTVPGGA